MTNLSPFFAVVDIGSNSVKFICCESQREVPQNLRRIKIISQDSLVTRLAKGVALTGSFDTESLDKTKEAFESFLIKFPKNTQIHVLATESARKVKDPQKLQDLVKKVFNKELTILTGDQEAQISSQGALAGALTILPTLNPEQSYFAFIEIGGGSSQVGIRHQNQINALSIPLGAVNLFEKLKLNPKGLDPKEWHSFLLSTENELSNSVHQKALNEIKNQFSKLKNAGATIQILGIGGTLVLASRTIAASHLKFSNEVGTLVSKENFFKGAMELSFLSVMERLQLAKMDSGRADVLPAGLLLFFALLNYLKFEGDILITGWGLRHGMAFKIIQE